MGTERFRKNWQIKRARMEAMFKIMDSSVSNSADELLRAAGKAERSITDRRGRISVKNFESISKVIPEIESLMDPTEREDKEWHTDKWVVLKKPIEGRRIFAVEIKSSDGEVEWIKNDPEFIKYHVNTLVLNSRKGRRQKEIVSDFYSELERVVKNIRATSSRS